MSTFSNRNRQSIFFTLLAVFVAVLWGALAHASTVTPSDAVTTYVVVRKQPSTQSAEVGTLPPGDKAEVLESVPYWLKVQLANHKVGYVSKRWVTETEAAPPTPTPILTSTPTPTPPATPTPTTGATAPKPLLTAGHPVNWWFVFKFNAAKFSGCGSGGVVQCAFGGEAQAYTISSPGHAPQSSQQYVYATSEAPALQEGSGCVGDTSTDPVGATFDEVYNGSVHYVVWNDQFYEHPAIAGCSTFCGAPWAHSKGLVAWNDSGEGLVMQVTTPSWPAAGSNTAPRQGDGNTLGCISSDNNIKFSQHFFALQLNHDDLIKVLTALQNASVVTLPNNPQLVNNGGPQDVQALVNALGVKSANSLPTRATLSGGVELISKPSALHVPPWQMVSALLGGVPLRVATWWSTSRINSTTAATPIGCWDAALGTPGSVEIATSGQWNGQSFGLEGGISSADFNHAKIGVSTSGAHHYAIFGDMNQEGALSGSASGCTAHQNGRGGLFFVIDNTTLASSVSDLIHGDTAPP
jgi:Deoxyribonuclease II/Bacterial SH3 domain